MVEAVQKRLDARDHTHLRKMLVHFDLQIGLVPHLLGHQMGKHGVGSAPVVGQVHREQPWIARNNLHRG
ncbi:Uncharacterised protein [Chlamydia trachomatis]|nr:Uncharacterised protein [Chlamydia trachomatis]